VKPKSIICGYVQKTAVRTKTLYLCRTETSFNYETKVCGVFHIYIQGSFEPDNIHAGGQNM